MSEARAPNYELAEHDYIAGMKYKDIAEKYNVTLNTVKSWKTRYKWSKENKKGVHTKTKKVCTQNKAVASEVESVMSNSDLNDKQRLFCLYYSQSFNGKRSYLKAYGGDEYSARVCASQLLTKPNIRKEIMKLKESKFTRELLTEEDIFQKYLEIAYVDMNDFVKIKGPLVEAMNEIDGTLVSEISATNNGIKIKLADRMKALQWLSDHMSMATDEQKAKIELMKAQIDNLNKDNDKGEGGVIIIDDIPRPDSNI